MATAPAAMPSNYRLLHDNRQKEMIAVNVVVLILAVGAVVLRFVSRRINRAKISYDDIIVLFALFFSVFIIALSLYAVIVFGLGKHSILAGVVKIRGFLKLMFVFEVVYVLAITITKLSILALYYRIFNHTRTIRLAIFSVAAFVAAWLISGMVVVLVQCRPIHYFWDRISPAAHGICYDYTAALLTLTITNILSDIMILLLPIPIVWHLHVAFREKMLISALFLLGGFVTVASGFRLHYVSDLNAPADPLWDLVRVAIWSSVEPAMAVVCANLATMRPLFVRYIQAPLSKIGSSNTSSKTPKNGNAERRPRPRGSKEFASDGSTEVGAKGADSTIDMLDASENYSAKGLDGHELESAVPAPQRSRHWRSFIPHKDSRLQFSTVGDSAIDSHVDPEISTNGHTQSSEHGIRVQNHLNWASEEKRATDPETRAGRAH